MTADSEFISAGRKDCADVRLSRCEPFCSAQVLYEYVRYFPGGVSYKIQNRPRKRTFGARRIGKINCPFLRFRGSVVFSKIV